MNTRRCLSMVHNGALQGLLCSLVPATPPFAPSHPAILLFAWASSSLLRTQTLSCLSPAGPEELLSCLGREAHPSRAKGNRHAENRPDHRLMGRPTSTRSVRGDDLVVRLLTSNVDGLAELHSAHRDDDVVLMEAGKWSFSTRVSTT